MLLTKRFAAIAAIVSMLAGCGGSGSSDPGPGPVIDNCDSTSYLINGACETFAERIDERAETPFFENGAPVELEVVLFKPPGSIGPLPTVMFNHGSTGDGSDPSLFGRTVVIKSISKYFVDRGWMVAFPQRPDVYRGAINFGGGWIAEGCGDFADINRTLFVSAAAWPGTSIWLYGENDSFYSISHSRSNFDAFTAAGGMGEFHVFQRERGLDGHFVINDLELWEATVDAYLERF